MKNLFMQTIPARRYRGPPRRCHTEMVFNPAISATITASWTLNSYFSACLNTLTLLLLVRETELLRESQISPPCFKDNPDEGPRHDPSRWNTTLEDQAKPKKGSLGIKALKMKVKPDFIYCQNGRHKQEEPRQFPQSCCYSRHLRSTNHAIIVKLKESKNHHLTTASSSESFHVRYMEREFISGPTVSQMWLERRRSSSWVLEDIIS